uniref:Uncharacterized protein n=1 Tax=Oryza meridionalis TaxID=40149 RepID=A0A0E0D141_9ORYZ
MDHGRQLLVTSRGAGTGGAGTGGRPLCCRPPRLLPIPCPHVLPSRELCCLWLGELEIEADLGLELLGLLPLLGNAQTFKHGVVGVFIGANGHGCDEAEDIVEPAGAAAPVDRLGDDRMNRMAWQRRQ